MIQVNRIYLIFNRLVTKKFLVDTSDIGCTVYVVFVLFVGVLFVLLRYWRLFPYVFGKC